MAANKKLFFTIVALYLAYRWGTKSVTPGEVVETKLGKVQGIESLSRDGREFYEWRGIPYAEPPVGELRYQTPRPAGKWAGVRDGSTYGPVCAQLDMFMKRPAGAEDCLVLNIATPKEKFHDAQNGKGHLPVMVWIHGGYFTAGSSTEYPPSYFMDEDVVFVNINYRLGALGFLSTQDENARGNMGLKDQALALRWVKDNIEAFGGDPESITIFGESAGGASVHYQLLSPKNKGIITRAISQSGTAVTPFATYADPIGQAQHYAKNVGCPTDDNKKMVDCLKQKDVNDLLMAHSIITSARKLKRDVFVPVIEKIDDDEAFVTAPAKELYAKNKVLQVPWMAGTTTDEGLLFIADFARNKTDVKAAIKDFNLLERVFFLFTEHVPEVTSKIRQFYFGNQEPLDMRKAEAQKTMMKAASDRIFLNSNFEAVQMHADKAGPVYPFLYAKSGPSIIQLIESLKGEYPAVVEVALFMAKSLWHQYVVSAPKKAVDGIGHGDDLFMLFEAFNGIFPIYKGNPNYEFSKKLVKSWVQFANGKQPEIDGVAFPAVTSSKDVKYIWLNERPKVTAYPFLDRYKFWKDLDLKM